MLVGLVPIFLLSMVIWRFAHMVAHVRPARPIGWLIRDLRDLLITDRARLASGAIAIFGIVFFAVIFSYVKEAIPLLNPFAWDEAFAELDRLVHGGVDPYRLLLPALGNAAMFQIADLTYSTWFLLIYFFGFLAAMDRENPDRREHLSPCLYPELDHRRIYPGDPVFLGRSDLFPGLWVWRSIPAVAGDAHADQRRNTAGCG